MNLQIVRGLIAIGFFAGITLAVADDRAVLEAARSADAKALRRALKAPEAQVNLEDARGFTPLFYATRHLSTHEMKLLLDRGADANHRTKDNVTAFTFAVTDLAKARLLIERGFDFKRTAAREDTALMIAARHPRGYEVVKLLVEKGADVNGRGSEDAMPLSRAIYSGDVRTVKFLLDAGADLHAVRKYSDGTVGQAFIDSIYVGTPEIVRLLLSRRPDLNFSDTFGGHSLTAALVNGRTQLVRELIEGGADLTSAKNVGEVPAIVFAAYNEHGDPAMAKLLLERGADLNASNDRDETILTWARKRGETELVRFLEERGAKEGKGTRTPEVPEHSVTLTRQNREGVIRDSVTRSIAILQEGSKGFLDRESRPNACVSCHHQTFPGIAFGWAKQLGIRVDNQELERQTKEQIKSWTPSLGQAYNYDDPLGGVNENIGYGLMNLAQNQYPADPVTEAMTHYLVAAQRNDGSWDSFRGRPPAESSPLTSSALAVRALQLYPPLENKSRTRRRLARARAYMLSEKAFTTEERSYQILGLVWAGAGTSELKPLAADLMKSQRADGGWGQIPTLPSDAYATGQTLTVLRTCGAVSVDHPAYVRGAEFLLRTQFPDGSWFVKSRSWPFQTHFSTGFPHGRDQWISSSATTWATLALMSTLDPAGPLALRAGPPGPLHVAAR